MNKYGKRLNKDYGFKDGFMGFLMQRAWREVSLVSDKIWYRAVDKIWSRVVRMTRDIKNYQV